MSDSMKISTPGFDPQALAQSGGVNRATSQGPKPTAKDVGKAAQEFEAVFLSQMLSQMWQGVESDETFGGGEAENTWRGMMVEEYGKQISKAGGLGLADQVKAEMIRMQEQEQGTKKGPK
ncbi:rod-binding protein [Niveispirillum sp.]|uniref:rod-binding protein n=1 Tax=Niveispirillum sp. TaxID=1917217 RepID=UPI001B51BFAE|nr:rod-binding protein [Niveispirillum sp.]MBP7336636.1 rod-binding protein [Niveispirillum sp.]